MSAAQLCKQPLCQISLAVGVVAAAQVADHIIPHKGNRKLFFDPDNLQSVTKEMHDTVCQQMERGTWQPPLQRSGRPLQNEWLDYIFSKKNPNNPTRGYIKVKKLSDTRAVGNKNF